MMAGHDIKHGVFLTADEYLFCRDEAEQRGLSISAFIRTLVINERRRISRMKLAPADGSQHAQEVSNT